MRAVMHLPLAGGNATTLASGLNEPIGIAVDGTNFYWTSAITGDVMKGVLSGGIVPTSLFASSQGSGGGAFGVAVDSTSVYWTNQGNTAGLGSNGAQIFDHGVTDDGRPYMVMEYLVGTSLRDRLTQEGVIPLGETAELLTGLCAALGPAHDAGLVHRDLKPENIFLVQERGRELVKLLDFGVAKSTRLVEERFASTATGDLIGAPTT
jgi:serine/threonine protein kinase